MYEQTNPYLYSRNSPIVTRVFDRQRFSDEELVVVTARIFTHPVAKGYDKPAEWPIGLIVRDINGTKIKNLRHLVETIRDCTGEFLTIHFADEPSSVLVFDRKEFDEATDEIMEENGIARSRRGSPDMLKVWKKESSPPK